ncbi:MAG: hypothetical protein JNL11_00235 [Bdellovibrionaceae bacterium]|nr:hypothetical protein [Pseudobdellovibrionaceae bacterium]
MRQSFLLPYVLVMSFLLTTSTTIANTHVESKSAVANADYAWVKGKFEQLVLKFPSLRANGNYNTILRAFSEPFGTDEMPRFKNFITTERNNFIYIRNQVNVAMPIQPNGKTVAVSGRSVVGLVHALFLVKMGYTIDIYDKRIAKTRNIQWALRQALLDQLAALDPRLAQHVMSFIAKPLVASVHLGADGSRAEYRPDSIRSPDPTNVPYLGEDMLKLPSVMSVEGKKLERILEDFIQKYSDQVNLINANMEITDADSEGKFGIKGSAKVYDEIVIAEGSHSENRERAGIKSIRTTAARLQIAGEVQLSTSGKMAKFYRTENGDSMISYTMETNGANKVWLVADVHAESIEPNSSFTPNSREYELEKERKIATEFRRLAAPLLGISPAAMNELRISGAFEKSNLPSLYWLDQKIYTSATAGSNLRLVGDAVGNATPTVGGGMQIGATSHLEAAKEMYFELESLKLADERQRGTPATIDHLKKRISQQYDARVIADTLAWHKQGVPDMYLYIQDGGVPITKLPRSHAFATTYNELVSSLNRKLENINADHIRAMTKREASDYYRVPADEIKTESGMKKWIKKVRDWAYHEFVRANFEMGIGFWKRGVVESPYDYLNEVLPERPAPGLKVPSWMKDPNKRSGRSRSTLCEHFYGVSQWCV